MPVRLPVAFPALVALSALAPPACAGEPPKVLLIVSGEGRAEEDREAGGAKHDREDYRGAPPPLA